MGFSVDYEFTQGEPPTAGGVWVIERSKGTAAKQKVQLTRQGNLMTLIPGWRPERRPLPLASRRLQRRQRFLSRSRCPRHSSTAAAFLESGDLSVAFPGLTVLPMRVGPLCGKRRLRIDADWPIKRCLRRPLPDPV